MKVLVINTGSSSIKYKLFTMDKTSLLAGGVVEKIGDDSFIKHTAYLSDGSRKVFKADLPMENHRVGLEYISELLINDEYGVIDNHSEISAVGHRVVHGGEAFHKPTIIDEDVIRAIEDHVPLAPLHNPANLMGIKVSRTVFPKAIQVAVFDTAFHQTMPDHAFTYAIPYELYTEDKIRRYGFHGTSHKFVSSRAAQYLDIAENKMNIISIHLGNGSSIAAVKDGQCIDTSMGMTPLAGLMMGTRCGDLDPAVIFHLTKNKNLSCDEVDVILNKKSGLLGITGTNDMREVAQQREAGCEKSELAVQMLAYQIKKYIGSYTAALGRVDGIVFTAGIGENSAVMRSLCLENLNNIGITLDEEKNDIYDEGVATISTDDSPVKVMVIPTNEELQIALEATEILSGILKGIVGSKAAVQ